MTIKGAVTIVLTADRTIQQKTTNEDLATALVANSIDQTNLAQDIATALRKADVEVWIDTDRLV